MKKRFALLLCLVLCVSLLGGLGISAWADFNYTVGQDVNWCVDQVQDENGISDVTITAGSCPGLSLKLNEKRDGVFLQGKPSAVGTYTISFRSDYSDGTYFDNTLTIHVTGQPKNVTDNISCNSGVPFSKCVYSPYGQLDNVNETWNGLTLHNTKIGDKYGLWLDGTPAAVGTHTFSVSGIDDGDYYDCTFKINVTVAAGELKITKSPTSEFTQEGGKALFISSAENYSKMEWRIVTADGSNCWRGKSEVEGYFYGVSFYSYKNDSGQECLSLSNIPSSMDGYVVQTKFWTLDGNDYKLTDQKCMLGVEAAKLNTPVITSQPTGAEAVLGTETTLFASASVTDGTLRYQWYRNTSESTSGGKKIDGATASSYTVPQTEGTVYYYCSAWASKDTKISDPVYTRIVAVTYAAPVVTPSPEPTPAPTPIPVAPTPGVDPVPTSAITPTLAPAKKDHTVLFVICGLIGLLAVCGTVVFLVVYKSSLEYEDDEDDEEEDEEDSLKDFHLH
ncbi:MAG: hypothetical protein MJ135_04480 [Oscillospiraceae bacterium]|nr:hypothetical protein [Oscillospiraceae bacterium]